MQKKLIIIYFSFKYKGNFVILQLLLFKIIYNILIIITSLRDDKAGRAVWVGSQPAGKKRGAG